MSRPPAEVLCLRLLREGTPVAAAELRPSPLSPQGSHGVACLQDPHQSPPLPPARPAQAQRQEWHLEGTLPVWVRGHPGGPSLRQADCPVHRWPVPLPTLAPVTARRVDTVLGTALRALHSSTSAGKGVSGPSTFPEPSRPTLGAKRGLWEVPGGSLPLPGGRAAASPVWQARPATLQGSDSGQAGRSSPPFWHGGWHIAVGVGRPVSNAGRVPGAPLGGGVQPGMGAMQGPLLPCWALLP